MKDHFYFKDRYLLKTHAHVMGILNVTPDSFSDGGRFLAVDAALRQAERMVREGAAIIDVGGESTRPGASPVSVEQEMDRVLPIVEALSANVDTIISIDTSSAGLMIEAASKGAHLINDVRALQRPGAIEAAAITGLPVCLMHMQGQPDKMQDNPGYVDVIEEVRAFFVSRIEACSSGGIDQGRIILDPGFGFGKTIEHNLRLMNQLERLPMDGLPLLVGVSRKSMIDAVLNRSVEQRLSGSLALAAAAVLSDAWIIRAHDVAETVDVVRILRAVRAERL